MRRASLPLRMAVLPLRMALAMALCAILPLTLGAAAPSHSLLTSHLGPAPRPASPGQGAHLIPSHVYAPYFETWTNDRLPAVASASGARYLTLAFLQTPKAGSCSVAWNGDPQQMVKPGGRYVSEIAQLRAMGGDVIPSFGGFSADQGGTEIADSCTSVPKIAKAYENVVTTYGVTRLDMDVEARSLTNTAGIARRSHALRLLQDWAAKTHRTVQIIFTLGVEPWGMPHNCFAVLKSAAAAGVRFRVNVMAFDYYIAASKTGIEMGKAAVEAMTGAHKQLKRLYPQRGARLLWALEGVTLLPGIDDYPKKTEVTQLADTRRVKDFAKAHGLALISIWAIQRDNGGCPGTIDSNSCSGIHQATWAFSHILDVYTAR